MDQYLNSTIEIDGLIETFYRKLSDGLIRESEIFSLEEDLGMVGSPYVIYYKDESNAVFGLELDQDTVYMLQRIDEVSFNVFCSNEINRILAGHVDSKKIP